MLMIFKDRVVDMQLGVPPVLAGQSGDIEEHVAGIMKKNGLGLAHAGKGKSRQPED